MKRDEQCRRRNQRDRFKRLMETAQEKEARLNKRRTELNALQWLGDKEMLYSRQVEREI